MVVGDTDIDGEVDGEDEVGFAPFPCFPSFRADMSLLDVEVKLFSDVDSDADADFGASTDDEPVPAIPVVDPKDVSEAMSDPSVDTDGSSRSPLSNSRISTSILSIGLALLSAS